MFNFSFNPKQSWGGGGLCVRWIPCQAVTSFLCLHYRPETVHCMTKDVYTSKITFLGLNNVYLNQCEGKHEKE